MPILPGRPYAGLCGFTDIVKGRNIIATLVSGGRGGGGYSALVSTNVSRNDFIANALPAENPLVLTLSTELPRNVFKLDFYLDGADNIVIDWGDTKTNSYTATTYLADTSAGEHTYDLSGDYTVSVSGLLTGFNGVKDLDSANYLTEIKSWGSLGIISLDFACNYIHDIPIPTSIPTTVRSMNSMFINSGYVGNDIGGWNVSNVTDMNNCFQTCVFNGDISRWFASESYTGLVDVIMNNMFITGENPFSQDLSNWLVRSTNHSVFNNNIDYNKLPTFVDGLQPTDLSATTDISSATLSWRNNISTTYARIQYKLGTSWTSLPDYSVGGNTSSTYTINGLQSASTYNFRVAGVNTQDGWTIYTEITATTRVAPPTDLSAVPLSATSIRLTWNNVATPTDTRIEKLTNSTWTIVPHASLGSATTYTVTDLSAATSYDFRITTLVGSAESAPRLVSSYTKPLAPSNLSGLAIDTSAIFLDWSNNTVPQSTRISWTSALDASSTIVGTDASSAIVRNLNPGTLYTFTAQTYKYLFSDNSESETVATKPNAPRGVSLDTNDFFITNNSVFLYWDGDGPSLIEYDLNGGNWSNSQLVSGSSGTATVTGLSAATAYQFRVYIILNDVQSAPSSVVSGYTRPNPPTDLSAVPIDASSVQLQWINNSSGTTTIEYALDTSSSWSTITETNNQRLVTGLQAGSLYKFRVSTVANNLSSTPSNIVRATTYPLPPTGLEACAIDSSSVGLNWDTGFAVTKIQYSLNGTTWTTIVPSLGNAHEYIVTGLTRNTEYRFRIATATSAYSLEALATTLAFSPTDLSGYAIDSSSVYLSWTNRETRIAHTYVSLLEGDTLRVISIFSGDVSGGIVRDISAGINTFAVNIFTYDDTTSGYSNFASIAVYPPAPIDLIANPNSTNQIILFWTNKVVADDSVIEYKLTSASTWTTSSHTSIGDTQSYVVTQLTNDSEYNFRVSTVKNGLTSPPSEIVSATAQDLR